MSLSTLDPEPKAPDPRDTAVYVKVMDEVKQRITIVTSVVDGVRYSGRESVSTTEIIFVQFRKVLEFIAFASMTANKEKYSQAFDNYHAHWKSRSMLKELAKLNPDFYPKPVMPPVEQPDGTKMLHPVLDGFLTQEDFVQLYMVSSEIIHMRNPFSLKDPVTNIGYSVDEWVTRIRTLLKLHRMTLINGDQWIVEIRAGAPAKLWTGVANP